MDKLKGRECLLELADLFEETDLPFFIMQGTALGAYRDHGFVPTERDIDFGVLYEDFYQHAPSLAQNLLARDFEIETYSLPFHRPRMIVAWKYGCKADIVALMKHRDKRFIATPVRVQVPEPYCLVHEAALVETWQTVELFGRNFNVPSPIEQYLLREYGPDWRTPQEDHVSRTRIYHYLEQERIPDDLLG